MPDPDRSDPEIIDFSPRPARNPHGTTGRSILGAVNYITAAICRLTGDQPATACTPSVRSLLPGG